MSKTIKSIVTEEFNVVKTNLNNFKGNYEQFYDNKKEKISDISLPVKILIKYLESCKNNKISSTADEILDMRLSEEFKDYDDEELMMMGPFKPLEEELILFMNSGIQKYFEDHGSLLTKEFEYFQRLEKKHKFKESTKYAKLVNHFILVSFENATNDILSITNGELEETLVKYFEYTKINLTKEDFAIFLKDLYFKNISKALEEIEKLLSLNEFSELEKSLFIKLIKKFIGNKFPVSSDNSLEDIIKKYNTEDILSINPSLLKHNILEVILETRINALEAELTSLEVKLSELSHRSSYGHKQDIQEEIKECNIEKGMLKKYLNSHTELKQVDGRKRI